MPIFVPAFDIAMPDDPSGPVDIVIRDYGNIKLPKRFDKVVILSGGKVYPEGVVGVDDGHSDIEVVGMVDSTVTSVITSSLSKVISIETTLEKTVSTDDTTGSASSDINVSGILTIDSVGGGEEQTILEHQISISSTVNASA